MKPSSSSSLPPRKVSDASLGLTQEQTTLLYHPPSSSTVLLSPSGTHYSSPHPAHLQPPVQPMTLRSTTTGQLLPSSINSLYPYPSSVNISAPGYLPYTTKSLIVSIISGNLAFIFLCIILLHNYRMFIDADLFYPIFWALLVALVLFRPKTILVHTLQKSLSSPLTLWDTLLFLVWWPWNNAITTIHFTLKRFKLKEKWRKYIVPYLLPLLIRIEIYTPPFLSEIIRAVLWISRPSSSGSKGNSSSSSSSLSLSSLVPPPTDIAGAVSSTTSSLSTESAISETIEYSGTNPILSSPLRAPVLPLSSSSQILNSHSSVSLRETTSSPFLTSLSSKTEGEDESRISETLLRSPRPYRQPTLSSVDSVLSSDLDTSIDNNDEDNNNENNTNNSTVKINYHSIAPLPTIPSHSNLEYISTSPTAAATTVLRVTDKSPSSAPNSPGKNQNKNSHQKKPLRGTVPSSTMKDVNKASPTMSVRTTGTTNTARTRETTVSWISDATAETITDPVTESTNFRSKEDSFWSWASTPSTTNSVSHMSDFFWNALYLGYTLWFISLYPRTALSIFLFGVLYMVFLRIRLVLSKRKEVREKLRKYKQFIFQHLQLLINTYYTIDRYTWHSISRSCFFLWWLIKYVITIGEEIIVYTVKKISGILLAIVHPISAIMIIIMVLLCGLASVLILSNLVLDEWREAVYDTRSGMVSLVETSSSGLATLQNTTWFIPILTLTKYFSPSTTLSSSSSVVGSSVIGGITPSEYDKYRFHYNEWITKLHDALPVEYRHNYTNMSVPELFAIIERTSPVDTNFATVNSTDLLAYATYHNLSLSSSFVLPKDQPSSSLSSFSSSSSLLPLSILDTMNVTEVIENGVNWLSTQWPNETEVIRNLWGLYKEYNSTISTMNSSTSSSYNDWYGFTYGYYSNSKVDNNNNFSSPKETVYRYLPSFTYKDTVCTQITDNNSSTEDMPASSSLGIIPSYRCLANESIPFVPSEEIILTHGLEINESVGYPSVGYVGNPHCELSSFIGMVDSSTNQPLPIFTLFLHLLNQKGLTIMFKPSCYFSILEAIGLWSSSSTTGNSNNNGASSSSVVTAPSVVPLTSSMSSSSSSTGNGFSSSSSVNTIHSPNNNNYNNNGNNDTSSVTVPWFSVFSFSNVSFSLYDIVADISSIVGISNVNPNMNGTLTNTTVPSSSFSPLSFSSFLSFPSVDSVLRSSTAVLSFMGQSTSLIFSYAISASASVVAFLLSLVLFLNLLFYLLAAERDWLTMALEFLPQHEQGRVQTILSETISGVFIVNAKMALYHALFTFLVLRIMDVHFVYTISALSAVCAVIPFFPTFLIAFPAAMELIMINGSSVQGTVFIILYSLILSYADWYVCERTSHVHPAVLGLSIIAGSVSFGSSQGALMGPLLVSSLVTAYKLVVEQFRSVAANNVSNQSVSSALSSSTASSENYLASSPSHTQHRTLLGNTNLSQQQHHHLYNTHGGNTSSSMLTMNGPISNEDIEHNEQSMEYRKQQILYLQAENNHHYQQHQPHNSNNNSNTPSSALLPSSLMGNHLHPNHPNSSYHPHPHRIIAGNGSASSADIWNSPAGVVSERGIIASPAVTSTSTPSVSHHHHHNQQKKQQFPLYSTQSGNLGMIGTGTNSSSLTSPNTNMKNNSVYRTPHIHSSSILENNHDGNLNNNGNNNTDYQLHLRLPWSNNNQSSDKLGSYHPEGYNNPYSTNNIPSEEEKDDNDKTHDEDNEDALDGGTFTTVGQKKIKHKNNPLVPTITTATKKDNNNTVGGGILPMTDTKPRHMTVTKGIGHISRYPSTPAIMSSHYNTTTTPGINGFTDDYPKNSSTNNNNSNNTPSARSEVATPTTVFARRDAGVRKFREQMSTRKR